jgi:hypothetical protein
MKLRTILILLVGLLALIVISGSAVSLWTGRAFLNDYWRDWLSAIGGVGTTATLIGLAVAFWQIVRTRSAAEAASQAASETRDRITRLSALVDLNRLCSQANEVVVLLRDKNVDGAALRVYDLRTSMTLFRGSPQGKGAMRPKEWTDMLTNVKQLEETLRDKKPPLEEDGDSTARHFQAASDIHVRLIELAASAAHPGDK